MTATYGVNTTYCIARSRMLQLLRCLFGLRESQGDRRHILHADRQLHERAASAEQHNFLGLRWRQH